MPLQWYVIEVESFARILTFSVDALAFACSVPKFWFVVPIALQTPDAFVTAVKADVMGIVRKTDVSAALDVPLNRAVKLT